MVLLSSCQPTLRPKTGEQPLVDPLDMELSDNLSCMKGPCSVEDRFDEYMDHFDGCSDRLLDHSSYVRYVGSEGTVDAEYTFGPRLDDEFVAHAMPPCVLEVKLSVDWRPGHFIRMSGPYGDFRVRPSGEPGKYTRVRLAPLPEFCVEVPLGLGPGSQMVFKRDDGTQVHAVVPQGVTAGGFFDVLPPCMMVQVPDGAEPGSTVRFRLGGGSVRPPWQQGEEESQAAWCRAVVPPGLLPGDYFPARIPAGL